MCDPLHEIGFDDWYSSRIFIADKLSVTIQPEEENYFNSIIKVNWNDIAVEEQEKIIKKQIEVRDVQVQEYLNKFNEEFLSSTNTSDDSDNHVSSIRNEIEELFQIPPKTQFKEFRELGIILSTEQLNGIQRYYISHIKKGKRNYHFIPSPNLKLECFNNPPIEVYAEAMFRFWKRLCSEYEAQIPTLKEDETDYASEDVKSTVIPKKTKINLEDLIASENLFVKGMHMEKVITHFKKMTDTKSKNGEPFLTQDQFISFLQRAFLNDANIPKQKINLALGEKGFVIKLFYEFFEYSVKQYNLPLKKEKYIKLISDNFENWNYDQIVHFFKPNKTREKW